jgi:ComF family protein
MLEMEFGNKLNSEVYLQVKRALPKVIKKIRLLISCCTLCGNTCQDHPLLCQYCQADLPYFKQTLLPFNLLQWPAITQLLPKAKFDHLLCIAPYQWPFSMWINQLKYQGRTELAELLSYLLSHHWQAYLRTLDSEIISDKLVVMSVPLHISKWQQRGFNQAHLMAKHFAKHFGYQYQAEFLIRNKLTQSQVGKSGVERRKNLANAFSINPESSLEQTDHIVLIDDVVTTGTTANEICKLLKKRGVQNITLLSLCLALPS